jgi:hypothetical protein
MMAARVRLLLVTLWAGSLWTVGYLVAPTLFATLPEPMQAGAIVGTLLRSEAWLSMACAGALLALFGRVGELDAKRRRGLTLLVLAMLACTLVLYFGVQPIMAELRAAAGPGGLRGSPQAGRFGMWHAISQLLYVIESMLAGVLIVRNA